MDTNRIDLNLLLTLEALLAEKNATRAAARLHRSQPALSAQLARLRKLFGDPLFLPAQRGMTPTARAAELEAPLRAALDRVRALVARESRFEPSQANLLVTIAASDYVQCATLMPLVLELRKFAPGVRLALRALDGARLQRQMDTGEIDLALMTADTAPSHFRSRVLFTESYVCIARRHHPQVGRAISLAQFCTLQHVVVSPRGGGFTGPADRALARLGRSRQVALSAAHFMFVPEIVRRSDLIALVPRRLLRDRHHGLHVCEPPIEVEGFEIALIWNERTHSHPGFRWVRERLVETVA